MHPNILLYLGFVLQFSPFLCSLLLGLRTNWENENIRLFGEIWTYSDALVGKTYEGFFEASFQLAILTHIQLQTSWPSMKPLLLWGTLTKAYYFRSRKPGKNNDFNNCCCRTSYLFTAVPPLLTTHRCSSFLLF